MPRKKESEKEINLGELAKKGLDRIVELSQSQLISEKLQSMNILLFVFVATVIATYFLAGPSANGLTFTVFLIASFILGLIISLGYGPILSIVTNFSSNKIEGLRTGITILFISLTFGIAALTFRIEGLIAISGVLILVQLLVIAIGGVLFPKISIKDREVKPTQIWLTLDRIAIITGIISFVIDVALFLLKSWI